MKKRLITRHDKEMYLIGKNADGENVYMPKASWDCGWYWGFGYLETLTSHTHFDSEIINNKEHENSFEMFKKYFVETCLTDDEIWEFVDYMNTFYTLKETARVFNHGYSYYTQKAKIDDIQDKEFEDKINKDLLPKLFEKIYALLEPKNKA